MESLVALIRVLRPSEKRLLLHYYSRDSNAESKQRLKLFQLINRGQVSSDSDARIKLYGDSSGSAYSHLKRRLKDDILNILLMQDTSKRLAQSNRAAELDCRKKVAQSHLLLLRGAQAEGIKVLKSAIDEADKYELLAERLQINHLLRENYMGGQHSKELIALNEAIRIDLDKYSALLQVQERSFVLVSPDFSKSLRRKEDDEQNLELISELERSYKTHRLARIGFWYYLASTEYYTAQSDYRKVVQLGQKFLNLVELSPAVRSKNNIAGVNQTLGYAYLMLLEFSKSIEHLGEATKLFPRSGFNRLRGLQLLAKAQIANNDLGSALRTVDAAFAHPKIKALPHLQPHWLFIKASVQFLAGEVKESFKTLNSDGFISKEVDEWNINLRILEMMQLVEFKDEEWLEFKLNSTRRFLTRNKQLQTPRVKLAMEVLSALLRNGLDMDGISEKTHQQIIESWEGKEELLWKPDSVEMVRFDKWVIDKKPKWFYS